MSVSLGMRAGGEVKVEPKQLEDLGPEPSRETRITIAHNCPRHSQCFTTCFMKSLATSSAEQSSIVGMNLAYLENLSTMTMRVRHPSNLGNLTIKSMETLPHGRSRTGRGSRNPADDFYCCLSCWHIRLVYKYASRSRTFRCILSSRAAPGGLVYLRRPLMVPPLARLCQPCSHPFLVYFYLQGVGSRSRRPSRLGRAIEPFSHLLGEVADSFLGSLKPVTGSSSLILTSFP
ncbi:hypothetical protein CRG98_019851 [Punica granatum]|uniref:Uncharacterized protein n=1 Tax=Punica granatum TaxID=22663 RepID=A0A2I0JTX5_PUNGR|nr:hypothetical protein CRG98_019851 [Punica granatum]